MKRVRVMFLSVMSLVTFSAYADDGLDEFQSDETEAVFFAQGDEAAGVEAGGITPLAQSDGFYRYTLASFPLPNQFRGHCPSPLSHCRTEVRQAKMSVWAEFRYPTVGNIQQAVLQCAAVGAVAAGAACYATGCTFAAPAFKAATGACLSERAANSVSIDIKTDSETTCWSSHC